MAWLQIVGSWALAVVSVSLIVGTILTAVYMKRVSKRLTEHDIEAQSLLHELSKQVRGLRDDITHHSSGCSGH
jgi:uncharacterized membrane protein